jgi:hypothetical protein
LDDIDRSISQQALQNQAARQEKERWICHPFWLAA